MSKPKSNPSKGGRPPEYRPEFAEQAFKLCLLMGATDKDLADFFEKNEATINRWKKEYPEFCEAIKRGKRVADSEIAHSLYQRGIGYRWIEQQAIKIKTGQHTEDVKIVEVERAVPPDTLACIYWLNNRDKERWRQKTDEIGDGASNRNISSFEVKADGRPG